VPSIGVEQRRRRGDPRRGMLTPEFCEPQMTGRLKNQCALWGDQGERAIQAQPVVTEPLEGGKA
jgi:hypothetical protein